MPGPAASRSHPPDHGGGAIESSSSSSSHSKVLFGKYEVGRLLGCGAFAKVYHARNLRSGSSVAIKCISKIRVVRTASSRTSSARSPSCAASATRTWSASWRSSPPAPRSTSSWSSSREGSSSPASPIRGGSRRTPPAASSSSSSPPSASATPAASTTGTSSPRTSSSTRPAASRSPTSGSPRSPSRCGRTGCSTPCAGPRPTSRPRSLSKKGYEGAKVDIWSCGVILFVLNAGYLPFNDPNLMAMYRKIYRGDYRIPKWTSPDLRRLISRLLDVNPDSRITVDGIIRDPWFKKGLEEEHLRAMMRFHEEVEDRISKAGLVEEEEEDADRDLNAFDIISFSTGFDLSGLFDRRAEKERFVSDGPAEAIIDKVEEVGRGEGLVVRRRRRRRKERGVAVERQDGSLVAWVEVYRLSPGLVVVEVERTRREEDGEGDDRWNSDFWREKLGPASEPSTPMSAVSMDFETIAAGSTSGPSTPASGCSRAETSEPPARASGCQQAETMYPVFQPEICVSVAD
ncbi:CBL-interacting serine/threonine-protein kinase 14-like [Iris pallida]|uniref:non-specific serine/threonine protein kinase n=1 Tax=Iris pallida TaxID=29817 RepID=A0AAX6GIG2_IRIPA|nr:CBL-interacting serine/threonine-protein kinase 14-like [Iris pallida]